MSSFASLLLEAEATDLSDSLCEVGVMIILTHLVEGGLNKFVFWALEMRTFVKAIPVFLEIAHMNRDTHVHTNYPVVRVDTAP